MPQTKIYLDKLELAYHQTPEFTQLLSLPKQDGEDTAFGWERNFDGPTTPTITLLSKEPDVIDTATAEGFFIMDNSSDFDRSSWEDTAFGWERNFTRPITPTIIPPSEEVDIMDNAAVEEFLNSLNTDVSCEFDSTSWENIVTIGNWHFVRGKFPGNNTNYKYNFRVEHECENGETSVFGYLYYVTYRLGREDNIYLSLANYKLYDENFWQELHSFETDMGLSFIHVSKVDIALDSAVDTSKVIYNQMKHDKSIDWIINGHRVVDRNETIKKLFWILSGSLNNPDAKRVLYIKQKEGLTINCYSKSSEIEDKSQKYYQVGDWEIGENDIMDGDKIFRNEVRLTRKDIGHYIKLHGLDERQFREGLEDRDRRFDYFREFSRKLIRWNKNGKSLDITTLAQNPKNNPIKEKMAI